MVRGIGGLAELMLKVVCTPVIVFEKSDLINASKPVCSHEMIRRSFITKTQGTDKLKDRNTASQKLKFSCMFNISKTFTNVKIFVFTA